MNTYSYSGDDFKAVLCTDKWKIGILRFSERFSRLCVWERHLETHEAFVLLCGDAVLYTKDNNGNVTEIQMEPAIVYDVDIGEWHHIVVSKDATVLVVENSDTSKENTEKVIIDD
ncbi:MAG: hypothetical protein IJF14_03085 [Clostridia bacterium]|nr:hypothetical protein [Clostridia bacterium]